ncbi:MAG TPA: TRAP transporter small permease [Rectinemataceae bacterium]|nr:TRAP transporter small permease [Rectinemataceae bacterium]
MSSNEAEKSDKSFLHSLSDRVNTITEAALFATLVLMVIVTVAQVVFRFFFTALTWSEELACFLLVFASLLGTAVAFKKGSHISVTFFLDKLPPTAKKAMKTFIALLGIGFFVIVAWYGALLMKTEANQITPAMMISMKWIYLMYPLAGCIVLLHFVDSIATIWKRS